MRIRRLLKCILILIAALALAACGSSGKENVPLETAAAGYDQAVSSEPGYSGGLSESSAESSFEESSFVEASFEGQAESSFEVHFIDVDQGDAALIICDGEAMMIDGGSQWKSDLIYTYLKSRGIDHLKYIIATHNDDDHLGGLSGALNFAAAEQAFCSSLDYGSEGFDNFVKYLGDAALSVPPVGTGLILGSAKGTFIGPVRAGNSPNNDSLVLKVTYGETSFLFTGDAEMEEEADLLASGADLACTVLKVAHHGSSTSTTEEFLSEAMPEYAVISCGAFNAYRHPDDGILDRLMQAGISVYRTDMQGDIICSSDGRNVTFATEYDPSVDVYTHFDELYPSPDLPDDNDSSGGSGQERSGIPENQNAPEGQNASNSTEDTDGRHEDQAEIREYILNTRSGLIHIPDCESVGKMSPRNMQSVFAASLDEVLAKYPKFTPCGICHGEYPD